MITDFSPINALLPVDLVDPINWQHPLAQGLKLWWMGVPGLDGGKFLYDLCGPNHGTLTSMGNASNGWRNSTRRGGLGSNLLLDGSAGYVNLSNPPVTSLPLTLVTWLKTPSPSSLGTPIAVGLLNATNSHALIRITASTLVALFFTSSGGNSGATSTTTVSANTWYHAAAVFPGLASRSIYVNGRKEATDSTAGSGFNASTYTTLGRLGYTGNPQYFTGNVDDAKVYNRALADWEAQELYILSQMGYPGLLNRVNPLWTGGLSQQLTTTNISSSANPSAPNAPVSWTATVSSIAGTPTGTVQFKIDGVNFGAAVALSGGMATSGSNSSLASGNHAITALYSGDLNFSASMGSLTQVVVGPSLVWTEPSRSLVWTESSRSLIWTEPNRSLVWP